MRTKWGLCLLAITMLALARNAWPFQASSAKSAPTNVGMVALLADPQKYDGKVIQTIGILCIEYEGDAIYFHKEDAQNLIDKDALSLRLSDAQRKRFKNLNLKYVIIEGTLYASGPERWEYGGAIGNITRLEAWGPKSGSSSLPGEPSSHHSR